MAEVLDVACPGCGQNYVVLSEEVRVVDESDTKGKVGATGVASGEGKRRDKDVEYSNREVVMCECPSCKIRKKFYVEDEDGEEYRIAQEMHPSEDTTGSES